MTRVAELHRRWMRNAKYRKAYESLEPEFVLAAAVIEARSRAGLSQRALAKKMRTTQPVVARLESGRGHPSLRTLERLAEATGSRLSIRFQPVGKARSA